MPPEGEYRAVDVAATDEPQLVPKIQSAPDDYTVTKENGVDKDSVSSRYNGKTVKNNTGAIRTNATEAQGDAAATVLGQQRQSNNKSTKLWIPLTVSLPLLVTLDMCGVSLVVPLLHQYFLRAGVTDASQRELLSSLFSTSQIIGGLTIGALSDTGWLSRRNTLILSFVGSAVAYALIAYGGLMAIVTSRIMVGLVKQTMTVSMALLAKHTTEDERAIQVGRLTASMTAAWIIGPSVGGFLYKNVGPYAPIYVACILFVVNIIICLLLIPNDGVATTKQGNARSDNSQTSKKKKIEEKETRSQITTLVDNFKSCFTSSSCLTSVLIAELLFHWVHRTTSYKNIATYYEARYGIEPHQRGYLQSYTMALTFVAQSILVRPLLRLCGGSEVHAAVFASLAMALVTWWEMTASMQFFFVVLCPIIATSVALLGISLKSVLTRMVPKESMGSVLATLDVLQNAAQVTVPFYRTGLFRIAQPREADASGNAVELNGDPDPIRWLMVSGAHWFAVSLALWFLLLHGSPCGKTTTEKLSSRGDGDNSDSQAKQPPSSSTDQNGENKVKMS